MEVRWKVEISVRVTGLQARLAPVSTCTRSGKCEPDFTAAAPPSIRVSRREHRRGHQPPVSHGRLSRTLVVDAKGVGTAQARTSARVADDGPLSVFDADGTAIVIHANPDKGITGEPKTGVAAARG